MPADRQDEPEVLTAAAMESAVVRGKTVEPAALCHTADSRHCMRLRDSVTILSLACGTLLGSQQAGVLRVQLFDSLTGFKVRGWVKVEGPESITFRTDSSGTRTLQLRPGAYREVFCASGYKPLKSHTTVASNSSSKGGVMLDPVAPPKEESPESIHTYVRPGFTLLHGYIQDNDSDEPLPGAILRVGKAEAKTDAKGHFYLSVPAPKPDTPDGFGTVTLICEKSGYKTDITPNLFISDEDVGPIRRALNKGTRQIFHGAKVEEGHGASIGQDPSSEPSKTSISPELLKWLGMPATEA